MIFDDEILQATFCGTKRTCKRSMPMSPPSSHWWCTGMLSLSPL